LDQTGFRSNHGWINPGSDRQVAQRCKFKAARVTVGGGAKTKATSMGKRELIDRILTVNRETTREYLADFSERELVDYWRQLKGARGPIPGQRNVAGVSAARRSPAAAPAHVHPHV